MNFFLRRSFFRSISSQVWDIGTDFTFASDLFYAAAGHNKGEESLFGGEAAHENIILSGISYMFIRSTIVQQGSQTIYRIITQ